MFERFTNDARAVVVGAQEQAHILKHRFIGTEHLLLALMAADGGLPSRVLGEAGLDIDRIRAGHRASGRRTVAMIRGRRMRCWARTERRGAGERSAYDLDAVRAKMEEAFGPGALDLGPAPAARGLFGRKAAGGRIGSVAALRRCSSWRFVRRSSGATGRSEPSTSCSASCARAAGSPPR